MLMKIKSICFKTISMWIEIIFSFIKIFSSSIPSSSWDVSLGVWVGDEDKKYLFQNYFYVD